MTKRIFFDLFFSPFYKAESFYREFDVVLDRSIVENSIAISLPYKYIYCRIFKAANSTVVATLYNAETGRIIDNTVEIQKIKDSYFSKPSELSRIQLRNLAGFYKFTFSKNPYERLASCYLDKVLPADRPQRKQILKYLGKANGDNISFDDFLTFLEQGGLRTNGHWAPQNDFLIFRREEYDFIGKVESLQKDLLDVLKTLYQKNTGIVNVNEHRTESNSFVDGLSSNQKGRLYRLYECDFDVFEYPSQR